MTARPELVIVPLGGWPTGVPGGFAEAFVPAHRAPRCVRDKGCTRRHYECDVCGRYRHALPERDPDQGIAQCWLCGLTSSPWGTWPYGADRRRNT